MFFLACPSLLYDSILKLNVDQFFNLQFLMLCSTTFCRGGGLDRWPVVVVRASRWVRGLLVLRIAVLRNRALRVDGRVKYPPYLGVRLVFGKKLLPVLYTLS